MSVRQPLQGYEILKLIGSGSFGLVYLAQDLKNQTLCAIKEFPVSPKTAQHFFRELSLLFTLDHPNIIKCLNLIYEQDRKNYLVFEYADGGSLRDVLNQKVTLEVTEALEAVRHIALGLAHAHEHQIAHRDLKPENILICTENGQSVFKVSDLGISCQIANLDAQMPSGSPAYMAPEQFYDTSSFASDLYSLGVMFYEMLTGDLPFMGMPAHLFALHLREEADFDLISHVECRQLIRQLMAKQPHARPTSAFEVVQRIDQILGTFHQAPVLEPPVQSGSKSVETAVSRSDFGRQHWTLRLVSTKNIPGSRNLFALAPWDTASLLISDARSTDGYNIETDRFYPQMLSEPICAAFSPAPETLTTCFATPKYFYSFSTRTQTIRRLFPHRTRITAMTCLSLPGEGGVRLVFTDSRRVYCNGLDGQQFWQAECKNYFLQPQLLGLSDGTLLVSSSPVTPTLHGFGPDGKRKFHIELEAPVLALYQSDQDQMIHALLFGLEKQFGMQHLVLTPDGIVTETEWMEGIYAVNVHLPFLSLFQSPNKVLLANENGQIFGEYQSAGEILADAWLPIQNTYAVLDKVGHQSFLNLFQFVPQAGQSDEMTQ